MKRLMILILAAVLTAAVSAQNPAVMPANAVPAAAAAKPSALVPQDFKLQSKLMGREMPYRVLVPNTSAPAQQRSVIYLLHGFTGHFDNWSESSKIAEYATPYNFIIVMAEGGNGFYSDSVSGEKYESYIVRELIPEVDKKFPNGADREHRAIAGLSMGGFGAAKFGIKYPELFSLAGSFSGALLASSYRTAEDLPAGDLRKALTGIFGDGGSPTQKANDILAMVREASPEKVAAMPFLYISCGTEDFLFQDNRTFVSALIDKKIAHEYREMPGVHDWKFWDDQVREFLAVAQRRLKS